VGNITIVGISDLCFRYQGCTFFPRVTRDSRNLKDSDGKKDIFVGEQKCTKKGNLKWSL
jgi:hypothetical protein